MAELRQVIAEHWQKSTGELCTIIAKHCPFATREEIVAELRRQAAANAAEADELEHFHRTRFGSR